MWFLSLGRTRSIPRDSTPSSRSAIFHNWGGGQELNEFQGAANAPCPRPPCFLGRRPRDSVAHAFRSQASLLSEDFSISVAWSAIEGASVGLSWLGGEWEGGEGSHDMEGAQANQLSDNIQFFCRRTVSGSVDGWEPPEG